MFQKPNEFRLADLFVGQEASFPAVAPSGGSVSAEMQEFFLGLTKDNNPCHVDEAFAREKGFKGKLVYGMLTASFYSTPGQTHQEKRKGLSLRGFYFCCRTTSIA